MTDRCRDYRPDHNGECLNCDEWIDAHDLALTCDTLRDRLKHEGMEHSECQTALIRAQAEIAALKERNEALTTQVIRWQQQATRLHSNVMHRTGGSSRQNRK